MSAFPETLGDGNLPPLTGSALLDPWRIRYRLSLLGELEPRPVRGPTKSEEILWAALDARQVGWMREYATGPYRLDFFLPSRRLAVEVDGPSHWGRERAEKDALRDEWHRLRGIETVRVADTDVVNDLVGALAVIDARSDHGIAQPSRLERDVPLGVVESVELADLLDEDGWGLKLVERPASRTVLPSFPPSWVDRLLQRA